MRKVKGLRNRLAAMFLSGLLVVGAVPGTVLASESPADAGQTSETAAEDLGYTLSQEASTEGFSEDAALQGEEAAVQYYTVTLDANGGYFENEWDDAVGEIVEQAQVVNKQVPAGGTVAAAPVFTETDQDGQAMTFAGWSLEPDGELVTAGDEEYAPVDSCTLYAVWEAEDLSPGDAGSDIGSQEIAGENTDQIDSAQDSVEADEAAEESQDVQDPVEADEAAEGSQDVQDPVEADEAAEESQDVLDSVDVYETEGSAAGGESSDATAAEEKIQPELTGSSEEEETVSEDAAMAATESGRCGDNVTWKLEEGTLTISGTGAMWDYERVGDSPSLFQYRNADTVIIENGVTSIGAYVFGNCYSVTSITIPGSVTSIGKEAFMCCDNLTSISIPGSVTSIGDHAFEGCGNLTSIEIMEGVTDIGSFAFYGCDSLTSITIPGSVTGIGNSVFYACTSLTSVTIRKGVPYISDSMFRNCRGLTSIEIPESVTSIGVAAFESCSNLTSIEIPASVTNIFASAFFDCSSLENILVKEGNQDYSSKDGVLFNSDQTILVSYPGGGKSAYSIPDKVTSIGDAAFMTCSNLTSITIPDSVTSISENAFRNCNNLTSITIPESVTSIGSSAFRACSSLTSITIPDSVTSIGGDVFFAVHGLVIYGYSGSKAQEYAEANNITFKILINRASVTIPDQPYTYTGNPLEPKVTVIVNDTQLTEGTDYEVTYSNNTDAEPAGAVVTVTGKGDYAGEKEITFTIEKAVQPITASDLTLPYLESGKIMVSGNQGQLSYTSSDLSVAEVDSSGNVTAKKADTATVTITAAETKNYKMTEKEITVRVVKVKQTITASDLSLTYMETGSINVSGNEGDLTYKSADEIVAAVDTDGIVTAKGIGSAKITITAAETENYKKATKEITVNVAKAAQSITASDLSLTCPNSGKIAVSGNEGSLTYKSSNTSVATVDSAGKVTAKSGGTAKITITAAATAQYNAASKTITVNVAKAAQSIVAKAAATAVFAGQSATVSVSGAKGTVSFKSSDTTIAAVDKSTGKVTAKKAGTVKITAASAATAQFNAASKTVTIKVLPAVTSSLTAANQVTGIKLAWKRIAGATGYKIYRNSTLIKTITGDSTVTYLDTKANTNMTRYIYRVVAKGPAGDSPRARTVTAYRVNRPVLSSVTNSAASLMTAKWTTIARVTGYQIKYSTSKNFASQNGTVNVPGAAANLRSIRGLTRGKTYYVKIRTYKIVGNGTYWSEWSPVRTVRISK